MYTHPHRYECKCNVNRLSCDPETSYCDITRAQCDNVVGKQCSGDPDRCVWVCGCVDRLIDG